MDNSVLEGDRLFLIAESLAQDHSLLPGAHTSDDYGGIGGLLSPVQIARENARLEHFDIDTYIEKVVAPAEKKDRKPAPEVIREIGRVISETSDGPFFSASVFMEHNGEERLVGFLAQDRRSNNGAWMPEHHLQAVDFIEECSKRAMPIVSLMDTPGADSGEQANRNNQAHAISRLIAEMSNADVPNIGVIYGLGYSGGAIPLAASNLILSVRDGLFSTIQPKGLANIARRLNLSWQECAKQVGVSPFQLMAQGNIDGVIDYSPNESEKLENFRLAIQTGIAAIEASTKTFVAQNPYIMDHYRRGLLRYLEPSERLRAVEASASLKLSKNPTEYLNVFGVAFRYLRYLRVRRRIKSTTSAQYGRLAEVEIPQGELGSRVDLERRRTFFRWLQDPDRIIYDDNLSKAWKNYVEKKNAVHDERGRLSQFLFGEPKKNYTEAREQLLTAVGMYLYNRWKTDAPGNFSMLGDYLREYQDTAYLFNSEEINNPFSLCKSIAGDTQVGPLLREKFTHEGKKHLGQDLSGRSESYLRALLTTELNLVISTELISDADRVEGSDPGLIVSNRRLLESRFDDLLVSGGIRQHPVAFSEMTVLDVLLEEELRQDFALESDNILLFDKAYDQILENLDSIAEEAQRSRELSKGSITQLLEKTFSNDVLDVVKTPRAIETESPPSKSEYDRFVDWYLRVSRISKTSTGFRTIEEWKKGAFPHFSDTLFVVVTFFFERLLNSFLQSRSEGKRYDGRIAPRNIGRKKDFWNRLNTAYRDLLIFNTLNKHKALKTTGYRAFIDEYFEDFKELNSDLMSSDPCSFPGFRLSLEKALQNSSPPCGVVTGIGTFLNGEGGLRVGTVISNLDFSAGAFDMASAEKFCKLLVECAEQHLPIVGFISSGGMQTKEGAGALFSMAAINDRITRFVRDYDLPVIVFGWGDCTGGAQASFVTHPLVQTYYFSGANMPFAGQIVTPSHLPAESIIANYLASVSGSMQGLVKHPFLLDLDDDLRAVDPEIPIPQETVRDVVNRVMAGTLNQVRPMLTPARSQVTERDLYRPIKRVLIHGRGCTAVKLIRIAQRLDVQVVLVQSDPDMDSIPVDMLGSNDTVVCIGGNTPDESYLNAMSVIAIAEHEHVDSLHPGIGFLSESSPFAELVRSRNINFIGPPVSSMETMGNKSNAINTAMKLGVPVVPGSHGIVTDVDKAGDLAEQIGYPVLIKAVHGGGGKGIQVVESGADFRETFSRVSAEAKAAFGNGDVYLEKYVTSLRHIEAQLLRDTVGNTRVLGIRDCSVQRDKQKVIEESGSTALPAELLESVISHTQAIADEVNYVGAGTVEFIYDLASDAVYFMEMNTRLQVEHPVTEFVSGVDIVAEQFRIAAGGSIANLKIQDHGYSIEARINAERIVRQADNQLAFRPSAGLITHCSFPQIDGIDVISMAGEQKFVSPYYDSMIAQVVVYGSDREDAAAKLEKYLESVEISGISTNIPLLRRILVDEVFLDGRYDTGYLMEFLSRVDVDALISDIDKNMGVQSSGIEADTIRIEDSNELRVFSPGTGIFYSTPSPSEPEYVIPGDVVSVDQTICQMEAFKIFTPLRLRDFNVTGQVLYSPDDQFEIVRVNVTSGQQVNTGDLLFVVKPSSQQD